MRESLYRGKRKDDGSWVYGAYYKHKKTGRAFILVIGIDHIGSMAYIQEVEPDTVGEYTGNGDKNKKRIFEGDILKVASIRTMTTCKVVYREGGFVGLTEGGTECDFRYMVDVEVIGNIHDNPELLEVRE